MTITYDASHRGWSQGSTHGALCLTDKFEVMKEIGDGSFGSVSLARVRTAGAHVARRGTLVAIKTMKKTFDSFAPCLELREIIFLRSLPTHHHLIPALDIFLDPLSKQLHIAMEYMDGNLYQLMKARDHKPFDGSSVKSILFQILSGLEHIHRNGFFHRDIKPENILVSVSAREDLGSAFKRYSQLVTPPSTPPSYSIKIADFGLAREMASKIPYTTYVSTRWYRAPEVLLRAGEYSAPVDIWAVGAMAVEVATLKPLFPGGNEVDQVWRVCEIMGSPGNWVNKQGAKVGGGSWKDGVKLAQKLGFSFPKMAPHTMDTILQTPAWPASLAQFVTLCLMWDPDHRPTSSQALGHEYFADAYDPLRPKSSSSSKLLGRKHSDIGSQGHSQEQSQSLSSKTSSWFRRSLVARESAPAVPQVQHQYRPATPRVSPVQAQVEAEPAASKPRPAATKRNTWTHGSYPSAAPMPILPSIRPVSPLSNAVTAQAQPGPVEDSRMGKKIGRQLSVASNGNHYAELHRQEAERALNGQTVLASPSSSHKESFFSHLRKRARRLSGRHHTPITPKHDDIEANAGYVAWQNGREPMAIDQYSRPDPNAQSGFAELDRALQNVKNNIDASAHSSTSNLVQQSPVRPPQRLQNNPTLKRHNSLPHGFSQNQEARHTGRGSPGPVGLTSRPSRRLAQKPTLPADQYETPDEQEELLDEALNSAHAAALRLDRQQQRMSGMYQDLGVIQEDAKPIAPHQITRESTDPAAYPTPSSTSQRNSGLFTNGDYHMQTKPIDIVQNSHAQKDFAGYPFPTPPYDENEWAAAAAASIFAAGEHWR